MRRRPFVIVAVGVLATSVMACAGKSTAPGTSTGALPAPSTQAPAVPTAAPKPELAAQPPPLAAPSAPQAAATDAAGEPLLEPIAVDGDIHSLAPIEGALLVLATRGAANRTGDLALTIGVTTGGDTVKWLKHQPLSHELGPVVGKWPEGFEFGGNWGQYFTWRHGKLSEHVLKWPSARIPSEATPPALLGLVIRGDRSLSIARRNGHSVLRDEAVEVLTFGGPGPAFSLKKRTSQCSATTTATAALKLKFQSTPRHRALLKAAAAKGSTDAQAQLERIKGGVAAYLQPHEVYPMTFGQTGDGKLITAGVRCDDTWATEIWQADGTSRVLPLPLGVEERILTSAKFLAGPSGDTWLVTHGHVLRLSDSKWIVVEDLTSFDSRYTMFPYDAAAASGSGTLYVVSHGDLYKRYRGQWSHVGFAPGAFGPNAQASASSIGVDPKGRLWAVARRRWGTGPAKLFRQRTANAHR